MPDDNVTAQSAFGDVPVEIVVSVGRAHPSIRELLNLRAEAILTLDKSIDDPVDILVGDRLIARGILEEVGEDDNRQLAVRLISVPGFDPDA